MITVETTALAAIELGMELSIHAQEVGRVLPAERAKYIEVFYNFLTADTPQSYDVRLSALRMKLSSVKTEMTGELRVRLNRTHVGLIAGVERSTAQLTRMPKDKIPSQTTDFNLPVIGISDELLEPAAFIEHSQKIANKIQEMSNAIAANDWSALAQIDQNHIQHMQEHNELEKSVKKRREKTNMDLVKFTISK